MVDSRFLDAARRRPSEGLFTECVVDELDAGQTMVSVGPALPRQNCERGGDDEFPAQTTHEVRRILKAFVESEWRAELDARLAAYQAELDGREEADRAQE